MKHRLLVLGAVVISIGIALYFLPDRSERIAERAIDSGAPAIPQPPTSVIGRLAAVAGRVELCGYGPFEPTVQHFYPPAVQRDAQAAVVRAADSMIQSKDAVERAVGLFTKSVMSFQTAYRERVVEQTDCEKDEACAKRVLSDAEAAMAPSTQELARLASSSRNPRVYALALHRCKFPDPESNMPSECGLLTPLQWAQLEPDNAVPWLFALERTPRADAQARAELLSRASQAKYVVHYWDSVFPLADSAELARLDRTTRLVAKVELLGIYAAFPMPHGTVAQMCSLEALSDSSTRSVCDRLARLLVERPDSRFDLSMGLGLGERLAWQADRLRMLRDQRDALAYISADLAPDFNPGDPYSCEFLDRMEERVRSFGRYGEFETARRAAVAAGKSNADLAADWRSYLAKANERAARESNEKK